MKFIYTVGVHPVQHCHAVLTLENTDNWVLHVLKAALWLPKVINVHVQTDQCCQRIPKLESLWTDKRLTRFVALEELDTFVVSCQVCNQTTKHETTDLSLLHWRSQLELSAWENLPWFSLVTDNAMVSSPKEGNPNLAPLTLGKAFGDCFLPIEIVQMYQLHVLPVVRRCVHSRLQPYMIPWSPLDATTTATRRTIVIFCHNQQFLVKQKCHCLSWPRQQTTGARETWPVLTAWTACRDLIPLQDFMTHIAQVIAVGKEQYLFIVNWSSKWPRLPWLQWITAEKVPYVHGLSNNGSSLSLLALKLALGLLPSLTLYHGTSVMGASSILENGFQVSTVHACPGTYYKCQPPYNCCCKGMLGPGVYFAELDKATSNCGRAAGTQGENVGAVLQCYVSPKETKIVTRWSPELCRCGCNSRYSDHLADWYHGQLFNSILLEDGAGVKRLELCVRRAKQAGAVAQQLVTWNDNREIIGKDPWRFLHSLDFKSKENRRK